MRNHILGLLLLASAAVADEPGVPFQPTRCEVVPLAGHQVSFRIDGVEKVRWHYGAGYPRPFFFPFNGPSGESLTRMGHPGAPDHDHHRSVWFAHADVEGVDFWSDNTTARVRQKQWLAYEDGDDEAVMASLLGWFDGEGNELMEQEVVAALMPMGEGEHALELQLTFRPGADRVEVELRKTNFGFLAVRVARSLSVHFGDGALTSGEGLEGERQIFGKPARWVDYSGPVVVGEGEERRAVTEGITYFDHPDNPGSPVHWHVREDGWMGAGFNLKEARTITAEDPVELRYLLYAHSGSYGEQKVGRVYDAFARRPGFVVMKSSKPHRHFEVRRKAK
jgi:hypothetical protein